MPLTSDVQYNIRELMGSNKHKKKKRSVKQMLAISYAAAREKNK